MTNTNAMEELEMLMGAELASNSFSYIISLAGYIMLALGLYTIAKRRGISNPWLAWIPFGQSWMLGCVSDQYQHVAQGQTKSKRKILLWLDILTSVIGVITIISLVVTMLETFAGITNYTIDGLMYGSEYIDGSMSDAQLNQAMSALMGTLALAFLMLGLAITLAVFKYMAFYDLYRSCDPSHATAFTALSIFLGNIAIGIMVLVDRNKDLGMKSQQNYGYIQPDYLPPQQPPQGWQQPPQEWQQNWQKQETWQQPYQGWQPPQQPQQPQDPWQNNHQQ